MQAYGGFKTPKEANGSFDAIEYAKHNIDAVESENRDIAKTANQSFRVKPIVLVEEQEQGQSNETVILSPLKPHYLLDVPKRLSSEDDLPAV